jgi:uncharacterized protein
MLYAILAEDKKNSLPQRLEYRQEHRDRLQELHEQGKLIFAGPHPAADADDPGAAGFTGSLIVAEFADLEEANAWAQADIYSTAGVFSKLVVKPVKRVF